MTHDLVVRLDGEKVDGVDDLVRLLDRNRIDKPVQVDVLRLGRPRTFTVTPKERAAAKAA
jgi:S1-C subfamily serine protease